MRKHIIAAIVLSCFTQVSVTALTLEGDLTIGEADAEYEHQDFEVLRGTLTIAGSHQFGIVRVGEAALVLKEGGLMRVSSLVLTSGSKFDVGGLATVHVAGALRLDSGAQVICRSLGIAGLSDGAWQGRGVLMEAGSVLIAEGAMVTADGQGYLGATGWSERGAGPGGGQGGGDWGEGGGGGHGNVGARPLHRPQVAGGVEYGDLWGPLDPGSGGGGAAVSRGGNGGGAIHLRVEGVCTLHGIISANGVEAAGSAGGGAGGSIWIEAGEIAGGGTLRAIGGMAAVGGGGSGGRIMVVTARDRFTGHANLRVDGGGGAGAGTCAFVDPTMTHRSVSIHHRFALGAGTETTLGRVTVDGGARWVLGEHATVRVDAGVDVEPGGVVDMGGGALLAAAGPMRLLGTNAQLAVRNTGLQRLAGGGWGGVAPLVEVQSLELAAGSLVTADGEGYRGAAGRGDRGDGPGGGYGGGDLGQGGGGGHGNDGARPAQRPQVPGGSEHGDPLAPGNPGSGGGGGHDGLGGSGGGAIRLNVAGTCRIDGTIRANGTEGAGGAGGGAGGSIWIVAGEVTGAGSLRAEGASAPLGGGGAGGRVLVEYLRSSFTGHSNLRVNGGGAAGAGTCAFVDRTVPHGGVSVFQRFALGAGTVTALGHVRVDGSARWDVGERAVVTVADSVELDAGGFLEIAGGSWLAATNTIRLGGSNSIVAVRCADVAGQVDGTWAGQGAKLQAGSMQIAPGARITADAQGYPGAVSRSARGMGPGGGGGGGDWGQGGGAGFGGAGARPLDRPQVPGGPQYGAAEYPHEPGSGGGGGYSEGQRAGNGGGAIHLIVRDTLDLGGWITANGEDATGSYGAGSGGSVLIQAGTIQGGGGVEARGGSGAGQGGAGGGGRVAVYAWNSLSLPTERMRVDPGVGGHGATAGSIRVLHDDAPVLWTGLEQPVLHGMAHFGWIALGANPISARTEITLESPGATVELGRVPGAIGELAWPTWIQPDGMYRLRMRVMGPLGEVLKESVRTVGVQNAATWHTGVISRSQTWSASAGVYIIEGTLTIPPGVTVTVEPGCVVKVAAGARIIVAGEGTLDLRGSPVGNVVFTSLKDDSTGGDSNQDGRFSVPAPGDWSMEPQPGSKLIRDETTRVQYAGIRHSGQIHGSARFESGLVHEVQGEMVVVQEAELTVESGTVVKFTDKAGLVVRPGAKLRIEGTAASPVVFTSVRDDGVGGDWNRDGVETTPAAGDWRWIRIEGELWMDHAELRHGGGSPGGAWEGTGMVRVESGATARLRRCRLENAFFDGLLTAGATVLESCILVGADRGLAIHGGVVRGVHCTFLGNRQSIQLHGGELHLTNSILAHASEAGLIQDLPSPVPSVVACMAWNPLATAGDVVGVTLPGGDVTLRRADPGFADPAGRDGRLGFGSACIDAAVGESSPRTDARGRERFDDPRTPNRGTPTFDGAYADIGALEFVEGASSDVDLVVTAVDGPVAATSGTPVTLRWQVRNLGEARMTGVWHDAIRLVAEDAALGLGSVEVAVVGCGGALAVGDVLECSAEVIVPPATEGTWRWQVQANARGEIFEGRRALNNTASSMNAVELRVPRLTPGGGGGFEFAGANLEAGFRLETFEGALFEVETSLLAGGGSCTIYAARGRMPTLADFEIVSGAAAGLARVAASGSSAAAPWYVRVVAEGLGEGQRSGVIHLGSPALRLRELGTARVGSPGPVTIPILGEGFGTGLRIMLRGRDGRSVVAGGVELVDAYHARAEFDLPVLPAGSYTLVAELGGVTQEMPDAVVVEAAAPSRLAVHWVLPETAREHRPFDLYLEYENPGNTDLPLPRLSLACLGGSGEIWLPGEDESRFREPVISFVRLSDAGTAEDRGTHLRHQGVQLMESRLRPAADALIAAPRMVPPHTRERVALRAASSMGAPTVSFEARMDALGEAEPMDWDALHRGIVPPHPHPLWTNAWARVVAVSGTTRGQYRSALLMGSERALNFGLDLRTEQEVLTFLVREALEAVQLPKVRGRITPRGRSLNGSREVVILKPVHGARTNSWHLTTTWYDGSFGVRDVPPGDYQVVVDGWLPAPLQTVTVGSGAVDIELTPQARAGSVTGRLLDGPEGTPVGGCGILAFHEDTRETYSALSDASGRYAFPGLPPGGYRLALADGTPLVGAETRVDVQEGRSVERSFVIELHAGIVEGVVRQPDGSPAPGSRVNLSEQGRAGISTPGRVRETTADDRGVYRFAGVREGDYVLMASTGTGGHARATGVNVPAGPHTTAMDLTLGSAARLAGEVRDLDTGALLAGAHVSWDSAGWSPATLRADADGKFGWDNAPAGVVALSGTARGYMEGRVVLGEGSARTGLTLHLAPRGTLSGLVTRLGRPMAGLPLLLLAESGAFMETRTDGAGRYMLEELPEGTYWLAVGEYTGPFGWQARLQIGAGSRSLTQNIDLSSAGRLSGRCLASDGATPVGGMVVSLTESGEIVSQTVSDADGGYGFLMFKAGVYELQAGGTNLICAPLENVVVDPGGEHPGRDLVAGRGRLEILVDSQSSGTPVAGAQVTVSYLTRSVSGWASRTAKTDPAGKCVLDGLAAGSYRVRVRHEDWALEQRDIALVGGAQFEEFRMVPGGRVRGVVRAAGGGVPGVRMLLVDSARDPVLEVSTDLMGTYELRSIPSGAWGLRVLPDTPWGVVDLDVPGLVPAESRVLDVELAVAEPAAWAGTLHMGTNAPVPFATVTWRDSGGATLEHRYHEVGRGFKLRSLPVPGHQLVVRTEGHREVVVLPEGISPADQRSMEVTLGDPVALAWRQPGTAALARHRAGTGKLQGLGDVIPSLTGDFAAGDVWPEFFGGDYGMQPPQYYMDQVPIDFEAHLGLYETALELGRTSCSGVAAGWDKCKVAAGLAYQAERDWNEAYRAMRAMNAANSGLVVTRATIVALKTWKLALGIGKFKKLLNGEETPDQKAMSDMLNLGVYADSLLKGNLIQGDFKDLGGYLSIVGAGFTIAQRHELSELTERRLKIAGLVRESIALGKDVYEGYQELQILDQNVGNGLSAYLSAGDNYHRAARLFDEGLRLMEAGLADCRTGSGTQAGMPALSGLDPVASGSVRIVRSHDPNDKSSVTSGAGGFLRPGEPILYTIRFENVASADAPAQMVRIEDILDSSLDWASFQPVAVGFNHVVVDVPAGTRSYRTRTRITGDPYPVDVTIRLDASRGVAVWALQSVDPTTGDLPEDPAAGFLPPNNSDGDGEGFVSFQILPRSTAGDRASVTNQATIVFAVTPQTWTPGITNRVDAAAPASMAWLQGTGRGLVSVAWESHDGQGSGVAGVDVYVSRDGGGYVPWIWGSWESAATLAAEPGERLAVYTIATDGVGNREEPPPKPDVSVEVPSEITLDRSTGTLQWKGWRGREYRLERSAELGAGALWEIVMGPVPGNGQMLTYQPEVMPLWKAVYYRLAVSAAP